MKLHIQTEIEIDAPPEAVWAVLTDFPAHAEWNPFIASITGPLVEGQRLAVTMRRGDAPGMRFRPTVTRVVPRAELRWLGHLGLPGLFDGEHQFLLQPIEGGRTRLIHGEQFSGLLVRLAQRTLRGETRDAFMAMNHALKRRVEQG